MKTKRFAVLISMWAALATGAALVGAQDPDDNSTELAAELSDRIDALRARGEYGKAARLADELLSTIENNPSARPDEVVDAEWLYRTLRLIARLPDSTLSRFVMIEAQKEGIKELVEQARYDSAATLAQSVLTVQSDIFGADHPETAQTMLVMARIDQHRAQFSSADSLFREAILIQEDALGETHPAIAVSLTALAELKRESDAILEADSLARLALSINIEAIGGDDIRVARSMSKLAEIKTDRRDLAAAEHLLRRALYIEQSGPDGQDGRGEDGYSTQTMGELAALLYERGDYAASAELYQDVIDQLIAKYNDDHIVVALARVELARPLAAAGEYDAAETNLRLALDTLNRHLGEEHDIVADALDDLGFVLLASGRADVAEDPLARAMEIRAAAFTPTDIRLARSMEYHGLALFHQERYNEAVIQFRDAANLLSVGRPYGDALRLVALAMTAQGLHDAALDMLAEAKQATAGEPRVRSSDELVRSRVMGPSIDALIAYNSLQVGKPGDAWRAADQECLRSLNQRLEPNTWSALTSDVAAVQSAMGAGNAIIGWLEFEGHTFGYALAPSGEVAWATLDEPGDSLLFDNYRAALCDPLSSSIDIKRWGMDIFANRIRPLGRYLRDVENVYVVAVGDMSGIPVDALHIDDFTTVADLWRVSYLPCASVLPAVMSRGEPSFSTSLLAIADPPFNDDHAVSMYTREAVASVDSLLRIDGWQSVYHNAASGSRDDAARLPRLGSTQSEAQRVARHFPSVNAVTGVNASDNELQYLVRSDDLARYRYIHIATYAVPHAVWSDRSAIILSQADQPDAIASIVAGERVYDGLLSVGEIVRDWHISAAQVTLSRCEALPSGRIDGCMDFAYAMLFAGARTVLISAWQPASDAAALLLERYYENVMEGNMPKSEGLRDAKRFVRDYTIEADEAEDTPAEQPYRHPYYWAGFVLVGDGD